MIDGLTPSSSKASSIRTWASPRADPPPSARAMRGAVALMSAASASSRLRPGRRRLRGAAWRAARSATTAGSVSTVWLASTRSSWRRSCSLAGAAAARISLEAVEVQHVELVDLDVDVDVGLLGLELLAHDRALQDLRGRRSAPRRRMGWGRLPGPIEAPLTSMATTMSASPFRISKGSGLTRPPSISSRPSTRDRREEGRQRHAGGDRAAQRALAR